MIIKIDVKKEFDNIQHLLMIKMLSKLGRELLKFDKEHLQNLTANIILKDKKIKAFLLISGTRQAIESGNKAS